MFGKFGYESIRATQNNLDALNKSIENVSNANSIGYKRGKISFVEELNGQISKKEAKEFTQGPLRRTNQDYDLALEGPGFFEVELPNGQRAYTRSGRFGLTSEGELITAEGYKLIPEVEPAAKPIIKVSSKEDSELGLNFKVRTPRLIVPAALKAEIKDDGTVYAIDVNGDLASGEKVKIGKIKVVNFNNPQGLEILSRSYYIQTQSSGTPTELKLGVDETAHVKQGYLEHGNVDVASEFMNMAQLRNLISAQFKLFKIMDKIYENVHYTISRSI